MHRIESTNHSFHSSCSSLGAAAAAGGSLPGAKLSAPRSSSSRTPWLFNLDTSRTWTSSYFPLSGRLASVKREKGPNSPAWLASNIFLCTSDSFLRRFSAVFFLSCRMRSLSGSSGAAAERAAAGVEEGAETAVLAKTSHFPISPRFRHSLSGSSFSNFMAEPGRTPISSARQMPAVLKGSKAAVKNKTAPSTAEAVLVLLVVLPLVVALFAREIVPGKLRARAPRPAATTTTTTRTTRSATGRRGVPLLLLLLLLPNPMAVCWLSE